VKRRFEPGELLAGYTVEAHLGSGALAEVYRVRAGGQVFALKVLGLRHPELRERFLSEARALNELRHPNLVACHQVIEVEGAPAMLLDLVDGPDLGRWLARRQQVEVQEGLRLFRGVVRGVAHAHRCGYVHRDLKPANVLLDTAAAPPNPRVADLGIARDLRGRMQRAHATAYGARLGTPGYMAPEQARDASSADARADLYSLGCLLHDLICGLPYRPGPGGDFRDPAQAHPGLPVTARAAMAGCLQPRPGDRLPSCEALLACLDGPPRPPAVGATLTAAGGDRLRVIAPEQE
jgi:serine/threonine protein kinase